MRVGTGFGTRLDQQKEKRNERREKKETRPSSCDAAAAAAAAAAADEKAFGESKVTDAIERDGDSAPVPRHSFVSADSPENCFIAKSKSNQREREREAAARWGPTKLEWSINPHAVRYEHEETIISSKLVVHRHQ